MTEELPEISKSIWRNFNKSAAENFLKVPGAIVQESDVPTDEQEDIDEEVFQFMAQDDDPDDDETEEDDEEEI